MDYSIYATNAATQILNFTKNAVEHAGPHISKYMKEADVFVREHLDDLNEHLPKLTDKVSKEWAEAAPMVVLAGLTAYTGYKSIGAVRKAISAVAWCGMTAACAFTLLLTIRNTNLLKN